MTIALVLLIAVVLITTFKMKSDLFHPGRFYVLIYSLLFFVYSFRLCRFQQPWSSTTMMLFWGGVTAFLGGGAIISFFTNYISPSSLYIKDLQSVSQRLANNESNVDWNWFIKVTTIVFLVFILSYLINFLRSGIIPLFSDNASTNRFIYLSGNSINAIAGSSGTFIMMLCAEALFSKTVQYKQKLCLVAMMIISFSLYFTLVSRMPIVRSLLYIAVMNHYMKKQISFKTLSLLTIAVAVFFFVQAFLKADITAFSELVSRLKMNVPSRFIPFVNPYAYAVNNIWNLDYAFRKFIDGNYSYNFSYGFEFFRGLFFYTKLEGVLQTTYGFDSVFNTSIVKVNGLNTVIYLWHFFKDFGTIGLFIISFILGTTIHVFYYNTLIAPSHIRIAFLSLIISMIAFSFMIPLWSFWNLYYETAILLIAHRSIKFS